jgi:hypothetical protein
MPLRPAQVVRRGWPALAALALLLAGCAGAPWGGAPQPVLAPEGPHTQTQPQPQAQQPPQRDSSLAAFRALLSGSQLTPAVPGNGSGELVAALDRSTGLLRWKISFAGLTGPVRRAVFQRAAAGGRPGAVVLPVGGRVTSPYEGRAALTPAQQADLLAGRWQVRLSTARYPKGEIGGPLVEQK